MSRAEQIEAAANKLEPDGFAGNIGAFIRGAEWADKNPDQITEKVLVPMEQHIEESAQLISLKHDNAVLVEALELIKKNYMPGSTAVAIVDIYLSKIKPPTGAGNDGK